MKAMNNNSRLNKILNASALSNTNKVVYNKNSLSRIILTLAKIIAKSKGRAFFKNYYVEIIDILDKAYHSYLKGERINELIKDMQMYFFYVSKRN